MLNKENMMFPENKILDEPFLETFSSLIVAYCFVFMYCMTSVLLEKIPQKFYYSHNISVAMLSWSLFILLFNPLSSSPTKWSNTLKQFVCKLPTNCLSVFDHFEGLAFKGLIDAYERFRLMDNT